jgi:integrase
MRGDGRVYRRPGTRVFWCKYHIRGRPIRESTGATIEKEARKYLRRRMRLVGADLEGIKRFVGPKGEKLKVSELLDSLRKHYEIRHKFSPQVRSKLKPLRAAFSNYRAWDLTDDLIAEYIQVRQQGVAETNQTGELSAIELALRCFKPVADSTINKETQFLGQAFKLRRKEVGEGPAIPKLKEFNVRQGFFERADFEAIVKHLSEELQDFARFGFLTGWRKGEIESLAWSEFNIETRELRLRGEDSKNRQPRMVTLSGELWEIIQRRWKARRFHGENGEWILSSLVFFRTRGRGVPEAGAPVREFRKSWKAACEAAGLQGRLFHDFRRTAARNMRRAGVPEEIAMKITGHKTTSMFRRYNITDDRDITEALAKTQLYVRSLPKKRTVLPFQKSSKEAAK